MPNVKRKALKNSSKIYFLIFLPFLIPFLLLYEVGYFVSVVPLIVPMYHQLLFEIGSSGIKKKQKKKIL